jgi:hypothetical protein
MADEKMADEFLKHVVRRTNYVAEEFRNHPNMPSNPMIDYVRSLLLENGRQKCPKLHEFLKYLNQLSAESLKNFFESVSILMKTMTKNGFGGNWSNCWQSFHSFMEQYQKVWQSFVLSFNLPDHYSFGLWDLLKMVYQYQSLHQQVKMWRVTSLKNIKERRFHIQFHVRLCCVMDRSPPRLKIMSVSPGIFCIVLRRFLANAAKSGQSLNLRHIARIFAKFFEFDPMMLLKI